MFCLSEKNSTFVVYKRLKCPKSVLKDVLKGDRKQKNSINGMERNEHSNVFTIIR